MNRSYRALALALFIVTSTRTAQAGEPERPWIQLSIAGTIEQEATFEDTLRELVGRIALQLDTEGTADSESVLARVRIDYSADGATVRVEDPTGKHSPTVRTLKREGSLAVFRESLAHVVLGEVEPLTEKDEPPPTPQATPPATPEEPPPTPVLLPRAPHAITLKPAWAFDLDTQIGGGSFGTPGFLATAGVMGALRWRGGKQPGAALLLRYGLPFEEGNDVVGVRVSSLSARALPVAQVLSFRNVGLDVGLGFGIDLLTVSPRSSVLPQSRIAASSTRADPTVSGFVAARFGFWSDIDLSLSFLLDTDLAAPRWVSETGSTHETVFAPSRLRPFLALGLDFTLAGPSRTGARTRPTQEAQR